MCLAQGPQCSDAGEVIIPTPDTYLPYSIFLAQPLFMRASTRELLVPFFTPWYGAGVGFEPKTSRSESGRSTNPAINSYFQVKQLSFTI